MTNKNHAILKETLDAHKSLHSIKFSSNELKNFELSNYELDNLTLKNMEIKNISFNGIIFKNCTFDNCIFHKNVFKNCVFMDIRITYTDLCENEFSNTSFTKIYFIDGLIKLTACQSISIKDSTFKTFNFDQISFKESQFSNNSLINGLCYSSKFNLSFFENNKMEQLIINTTTFEKNSFTSNQILRCSFKKNIFSDCQFNNNALIKVTALKNTGLEPSILETIQSNKGRIKPYYFLLFKHPVYTLFGIATIFLVPFFLYYQLAINPHYEFFRDIFNQTFSQFYRTDFSSNVFVIFKITFKQRQLIPILNQAIAYKNNKNPQKAIQKLLNLLPYIESDSNDNRLYILIITWILDLETKDEECKKHYKTFIQSIPPAQRNTLRLFFLKQNERKYFRQTSVLVLQDYLIETSTPDEVGKLIFTLNESYNTLLKENAGIIIHSFIKRFIERQPDQQLAYTQLSELIKQWEI